MLKRKRKSEKREYNAAAVAEDYLSETNYESNKSSNKYKHGKMKRKTTSSKCSDNDVVAVVKETIHPQLKILLSQIQSLSLKKSTATKQNQQCNRPSSPQCVVQHQIDDVTLK
jgi:hypothetical protein